MLRWTTAGESHGQALVALLEGLPAGVRVDRADVEAALRRRRGGHGRGSRMSFEADALTFLAGLRHGVSLGSPLALQIANSEWPKWQAVMSPEPVAAGELEGADGSGDVRELARNRPLTRPRPGHADLVGMLKYGFDEARPVLERASARETAARVALGAVAQALLRQVGDIEVVGHTVSIGGVGVPSPEDDAPGVDELPTAADRATLDADPVRSHRPERSAAMVAEIDAAKSDGDTLGGVVEVVAWNLPPGLGSYVQADQRLDARLAGALMSIQAVKGVEVGEGFRTAARRGSVAHDEIERDADGRVRRRTARAGGTEGGMSTGEALRVRAAMKPISTVPRALRTVDTVTGDAATASHQRSDVCAVPAAGVVAEAVVSLVLAQALLEKVGGDSLTECRRNLQGYLASVPPHLLGARQGERA